MKAPRLRVGVVILGGVALILAALSVATPAVADEAQLRDALDSYEAGKYEEALVKLREYVASEPENSEVYAVLRKADEKVLLRILARTGEDERLLKYLMSKAQPEAVETAVDADEIQKLVRDAVHDDALDVRRRAGMKLRAAGELAVPHLYGFLASQDAEVVVNAMFALHHIGPDATLALAEVLESDNARLRGFVAVVLGDIGDPMAVPALLRACELDDDAGVREKATGALQKIGGQRAVGIPAVAAYTRVGERLYSNDPTVVAGYGVNRNMWRWEDGNLVRYTVPAYLYPYQMAEQFAVDALDIAQDDRGARALLVRALLAQKAEVDALAAAGEDTPEALGGAFDLAVSQGFDAATDALRACLDGGEWDVAVECMDLLQATYGKQPLNNHPLGDALDAAEKRVQYAAAIAALHMSPRSGLPNADKVAGLAARAASESAIRQVLVIDDRDETRSRLIMDLAHAGYVVAGESNGATGVNRAKTSPTLDVVIVRADLGDPSRVIESDRHTSSYTVIDELKSDARTKNARVVLLVQDTMEKAAGDVIKDHFQSKYGDAISGFIMVPLDTATAMEAVNTAAQAGDLNADRERANALAASAAAAFASTDFSCATFQLDVAVEPLAGAALEGPTDEVRLNAIRALGNIRAGGGAALAKILNDGAADELRAAAATALGSVLSVHDGDADQIAALMNAAGGEGAVAEAALKALGQVRGLTGEQRRQIFKDHRLGVGARAD